MGIDVFVVVNVIHSCASVYDKQKERERKGKEKKLPCSYE